MTRGRMWCKLCNVSLCFARGNRVRKWGRPPSCQQRFWSVEPHVQQPQSAHTTCSNTLNHIHLHKPSLCCGFWGFINLPARTKIFLVVRTESACFFLCHPLPKVLLGILNNCKSSFGKTVVLLERWEHILARNTLSTPHPLLASNALYSQQNDEDKERSGTDSHKLLLSSFYNYCHPSLCVLCLRRSVTDS